MKSRHFKQEEFQCSCGKCDGGSVNDKVIVIAELIRTHFGRPVKITSGYRCESHNKEIGGTKNSQHVLGTAIDVVVKDVEAIEVYNFIDFLFPNSFGIGKYQNFTHIDVREKKARW
jgi:uncharacterized protein YcbK (DUF882 family)